ncbi:MAG TPA: YsnF/AvaK domain-containing protein [Trebonia sp.]
MTIPQPGGGDPAGLTAPVPGTVSEGTARPGDTAMTRSEERLLIGTELIESGRVRVSKFIVTEDVTLTVQLRREEVRLEWLPAEPGFRAAAPGEAVRPEAFELVLHAERPVVVKEIVPVERVRLATRIVTGNVTVHETLRKERIGNPDIEMDGKPGR